MEKEWIFSNVNAPLPPPPPPKKKRKTKEKKKKRNKTKVMIASSYLAFHLHKMVGLGTLKNNFITACC